MNHSPLVLAAFAILALSTACPGGADEPCTAAIPADAVVVTDIVTADATGSAYWVCDGGNLTVNNGSVEVYAESGAAVTANGGTVDLWARAGANVTANSGDGEYSIEAGANFTSNTTALTQVNCSSLTFDTTDAPSPGCD